MDGRLLLLLLLQFVLMAGIAWLAAAANVFMRDVENVIGVGLTLVFYCTPVFYRSRASPSGYQKLLRLNPMTTMVESYRAVLMGTEFPSAARRRAVAVASALLALAGGCCSARRAPVRGRAGERRPRRPRGGLEVLSALRASGRCARFGRRLPGLFGGGELRWALRDVSLSAAAPASRSASSGSTARGSRRCCASPPGSAARPTAAWPSRIAPPPCSASVMRSTSR